MALGGKKSKPLFSRPMEETNTAAYASSFFECQELVAEILHREPDDTHFTKVVNHFNTLTEPEDRIGPDTQLANPTF